MPNLLADPNVGLVLFALGFALVFIIAFERRPK